jgi:hypothetical protein
MGFCRDDATTYLKRLGYNVVRHPREGIQPLDLIGQQRRSTNYLGGIDRLITEPSGSPPTVERDLVAADVNGRSSSELNLSVGANVLGAVVGAMGGNLGVNTAYTNARSVEFQFRDVLQDRVAPLDVGNYLRDGNVDASNPVLREYILGNGHLHLITETIRTKQLTVSYQRSEGVAAKVEVPVLQELVGGNVEVKMEAQAEGKVTFEGPDYLAFGFRCYEIGVDGPYLRMFASKAGAVPLAVDQSTTAEQLAETASLLTDEGQGLLDLRMDDSS